MKIILIAIFITLSNISIGQNREDLLRSRVHDWIEFTFSNDSVPLSINGFGETFYCIGDTNSSGKKHGTWIYVNNINKKAFGLFIYGEYNNGQFNGIWRSLSIKFKNRDTLNIQTAYKVAAGHNPYKKILFDFGHTEYNNGTTITKLDRFSAVSNKEYAESYYINKCKEGNELTLVYSRKVEKNKTVEIILSNGINSTFYFDPKKLPPTKNKQH